MGCKIKKLYPESAELKLLWVLINHKQCSCVVAIKILDRQSECVEKLLEKQAKDLLP